MWRSQGYPCDVGRARIVIDTGGNRFIPAEVIGFHGSNAVVMPSVDSTVSARLPCGHCHGGQSGAAVIGLARPRHQRHGRTDRRQGAAGAGAIANALPQFAAAGAFAQAGRGAARSRRPCAQHVPDLLPRPAARHLRRFRRRQIGAAVDAGAQRRCRHYCYRPDRRTWPRGAGISAGGSRRRGSCALGRGGGDVG